MAEREYRYLNIFGRVFRHFFAVTPVAGTVTLVYFIISGLFPAFTALVLAALFDEASVIAQSGGGAGRLMLFGLVYLIAYVANSLLDFAAGLVMELGADKRQVDNRYRMCQKLSKMPLISFEDARIKDMQARAEDCLYSGKLGGIMFNSLNIAIGCFVNFIAVSAVLARYSPWFLPLCLISVAPYCIARLVRGKEFYRVKYDLTGKSRKLAYFWGLFTDKRPVKELRALGADSYIFGKWAQTRDESMEQLWNQSRKDAVSMLLCDALRIIGYGACIALALWLALRGDVSVGVFGACIAAFLTLQTATRGVMVLSGELPGQLAFADDYFTYIDLPERNDGGAPYPGLGGKIEVRNLSFKYPNAEKYALSDLSLEICKGEKIAILGENGSGKTTFTKLLLGMYLPTKGQVLYDGTDVAVFDATTFRKTVSAIPQNFAQYKLPLRENIAMSDTGSVDDNAKIIEALRSAGLAYLLDTTGLDGELGTAFGGGEISGGEWQKLAIARGLFRSSELIVLDEPTSALDPLIETEILSGFIELAKDKTAVIISHRVGLCRLVDKIVVMKDSKIVESGTHDALLALGGEYARLFTAQAKWYQ
ncbi:MAG: ABC transporter ATP-binding protein/permease [Oscillospiraceae bacterium]|jgi:ABC-type multidrug transport system fused ATPase/permease subunit|nr:ABC transporter ATP-binding protein/permease [Oscillospiraceae bacterium]